MANSYKTSINIITTKNRYKERISVANSFIKNFGYKIPTVVDNINDDFTNAYSAWPFRAFMININGKTKEYHGLCTKKCWLLRLG